MPTAFGTGGKHWDWEVLVYRRQEETADPRALQAALVGALADSLAHPTIERARELLIAYGELETALADAQTPARDDWNPALAALRRGAHRVGRLFCAAVEGRDARPLVAPVREILLELATLAWPSRVTVRQPEGYAHYALFPEQYVDAARGLLRACEPGPIVCVGLRSIGASLSAAVCGLFESRDFDVRSCTVRPRGHPFDRVVEVSDELARLLCHPPGALYLVVDEGPGLSGSSFAAVTRLLHRLGVPPSQIVLMPSWEPDPASFVSKGAGDEWRRHRHALGHFDPRTLWPGQQLSEISAGAWRARAFSGEAAWPAVQPQHERRKYVVSESGRPRAVERFAGFGRVGAARLARATHLARAGLAPAPLGLAHGFLRLAFVDGRPLAPGDRVPLEPLARYLALAPYRPGCAPQGDREALVEMTFTNVRACLGDDAVSALPDLERAARTATVDAAIVDGRLQRHEWLHTADGLLKTDALDHGDDHFFPGPTDPAWDVAGACVELTLDQPQQAQLVVRYRQLARDPTIGSRLPFFLVAYLAFRTAYVSLAAETLRGSTDGARFATLLSRYRDALAAAVRRGRP